MSPVHRSSSTVDTMSNAAIAAALAAQQHFSEGEEDLEDAGIQRSSSMPPAMFHVEVGRQSRDRSRSDRGRAGICIQRNHQQQGVNQRHRIIQESQSEDELMASGGVVEGEPQERGEEEVEVEEPKVVEELTESYPRGRRNAFRGARVVRRATCAADGSYNTARSTTAERPE